jgi:Tfp pilus assembly protein PilF
VSHSRNPEPPNADRELEPPFLITSGSSGPGQPPANRWRLVGSALGLLSVAAGLSLIVDHYVDRRVKRTIATLPPGVVSIEIDHAGLDWPHLRVQIRDVRVGIGAVGPLLHADAIVVRDFDDAHEPPHHVDVALHGVALADETIARLPTAIADLVRNDRRPIHVDLAYALDPEQRSFELKRLTVQQAGRGAIQLAIGLSHPAIGGTLRASNDVADSAPSALSAAAADLAASTALLRCDRAELQWTDAGLLAEAIFAWAHAHPALRSTERPHEVLVAQLEASLDASADPRLQVNRPLGAESTAALRTMLERPGHLRLTALPREPIAVGQIPVLALTGTLADAFDLRIDASPGSETLGEQLDRLQLAGRTASSGDFRDASARLRGWGQRLATWTGDAWRRQMAHLAAFRERVASLFVDAPPSRDARSAMAPSETTRSLPSTADGLAARSRREEHSALPPTAGPARARIAVIDTKSPDGECLQRSTDGGRAWSPLGTPTGGSALCRGGRQQAADFFIVGAGDEEAVVAIDAGDVFVLGEDAHWEKRALPHGKHASKLVPSSRAARFLVIAVRTESPQNGGTSTAARAADERFAGMFRTEDGGHTWQTVPGTMPLDCNPLRSLCAAEATDDLETIVLRETIAGHWLSRDGGRSWRKLSPAEHNLDLAALADTALPRPNPIADGGPTARRNDARPAQSKDTTIPSLPAARPSSAPSDLAAARRETESKRLIALADEAIGVSDRRQEKGVGSLTDAEGAHARELLEQALKVTPDNPEALVKLGALFTLQRNFSAAEPLYRRAITERPRDAVAHAGLGSALFGQGQVAAAIASTRESVRLDPSLTAAYRNLAHFLRAAGDDRGAEEAHRRAEELERSSGD